MNRWTYLECEFVAACGNLKMSFDFVHGYFTGTVQLSAVKYEEVYPSSFAKFSSEVCFCLCSCNFYKNGWDIRQNYYSIVIEHLYLYRQYDSCCLANSTIIFDELLKLQIRNGSPSNLWDSRNETSKGTNVWWLVYSLYKVLMNVEKLLYLSSGVHNRNGLGGSKRKSDTGCTWPMCCRHSTWLYGLAGTCTKRQKCGSSKSFVFPVMVHCLRRG